MVLLEIIFCIFRSSTIYHKFKHHNTCILDTERTVPDLNFANKSAFQKRRQHDIKSAYVDFSCCCLQLGLKN